MGSRDLLTKTLAEMARRPEDDHALTALARRAGLSPFQLHRAFRARTGETPKAYVERLRLDLAAACLLSTSDSILTIALEAGYSGHEVFTRAFRRRFGCSPNRYRTTRAGEYRGGCGGVEPVRTASPCIRLFGLPPGGTQGDFSLPDITVDTRRLEAQPIIYIQRRAPRTGLQPVFADCFPKIFQACLQAGIEITGQPVARYVSAGEGLWTVDCAIPVAAATELGGEFATGALQAGLAAFAVHKGAYDRLAETHAAMQLWVEENGFERAGPAWESFVTSPAQHPDVADWRTEVFWPLKEAAA